jgi:teichuronic acid biosynthesis glycosyltransferase TuaC
MKVLFISSGTSKYGISPIVSRQGESLLNLGIKVEYFTIPQNGFKGYGKALFQLRKVLKESNYDVLHAHYGLCGIIAFFAKRKESLVVSFMGDDLVGTNKANGSVTFISRILVLINAFFARHLYSYSIVKSKGMYKVLKGNRKALIPNGINLEKFSAIPKHEARSILSIDLETKLVIFIADINRPEKNFSLATQAISLTDIQKIQLNPLNAVNPEMLLNYYNAADVLILTSFHEGSPNVIKEAMACNCPIVSTDVGDVRWVTGNTEGCFIASFDPADVADKIKKAIHFTETVGRTNGRSRIIELGLDSQSVAKRIIEIYKKVAEK